MNNERGQGSLCVIASRAYAATVADWIAISDGEFRHSRRCEWVQMDNTGSRRAMMGGKHGAVVDTSEVDTAAGTVSVVVDDVGRASCGQREGSRIAVRNKRAERTQHRSRIVLRVVTASLVTADDASGCRWTTRGVGVQ